MKQRASLIHSIYQLIRQNGSVKAKAKIQQYNLPLCASDRNKIMGDGGSYVQKRGPWWKMSLLKRNTDIYIAAVASIEWAWTASYQSLRLKYWESLQEDSVFIHVIGVTYVWACGWKYLFKYLYGIMSLYVCIYCVDCERSEGHVVG